MWLETGNSVSQSTELLERKTLSMSLIVAQNDLSLTDWNTYLKYDHHSLVLLLMVQTWEALSCIRKTVTKSTSSQALVSA